MEMKYFMKENSPFTPGNPVPVELFVGRVEQIKEILKYARQSTRGRLENIFLVGENGILWCVIWHIFRDNLF